MAVVEAGWCLFFDLDLSPKQERRRLRRLKIELLNIFSFLALEIEKGKEEAKKSNDIRALWFPLYRVSVKRLWIIIIFFFFSLPSSTDVLTFLA